MLVRHALLLLPLLTLSACDAPSPSEDAAVSGTVVFGSRVPAGSPTEPAAGLVVYLGSDPICLPISRCEPPPSIGRPVGQARVTADGSFTIRYDSGSDPQGLYVRCAAPLPGCEHDRAFLRFRSFTDGGTLYARR